MSDDTRRSVRLHRVAPGQFVATNPRGGQILLTTADGDPQAFTPVEALLAAIGGCTAMDVDALTSRRAEPESFEIVVEADKVRDGSGNRLTGIEVTFRVRFPEGEAGDAAREVLPAAVARSHDRLCTVTRTVELPSPVASRIE